MRILLHTTNLRARKAARKPAMTAFHRHARMRWCREHLRWNQEMWQSGLFSNELRFCLRKLDGRIKVSRRPGEQFAGCCVDRVTAFGGGSVMMWGGISAVGKTPLIVIDGNMTAQGYRDEVLQPVALPYLRRNLGRMPSSEMTTLVRIEQGSSTSTCGMRAFRGWNGQRAALTSIPSNTCGISSADLSGRE